jgi:endonuclease G
MNRNTAPLYLFLSIIPSFIGNTAIYAQAVSNDTITIKHKSYTTAFSKSKRFSIVVKYWLTKAMLSCQQRIKRTNKFRPDPLLPDYTNLGKDYRKSGYDRGHNMAAADCGCDLTGIAESFYYSNICPQTRALNRGRWKSLEQYIRRFAQTYDSVLVWCGAVASSGNQIGKVNVPDYCWKIIYIKRLGAVEAYSFKNDTADTEIIENYRVPLDSIRRLSGLFFFDKDLAHRFE